MTPLQRVARIGVLLLLGLFIFPALAFADPGHSFYFSNLKHHFTSPYHLLEMALSTLVVATLVFLLMRRHSMSVRLLGTSLAAVAMVLLSGF